MRYASVQRRTAIEENAYEGDIEGCEFDGGNSCVGGVFCGDVAPSVSSPSAAPSTMSSPTKSTTSTATSRSTKTTPAKSSSQYVTHGVLHGTGYTYKVPAGYEDAELNTGMDSYVYNTKDKAKLGITIKTPGPDETACSIRDNAIKEYQDKGAAKAEPDLSFGKIQGCGISFSDDRGIFIVYIIIRDGRVYQILNYADKASYEKRLVMIKSVAESWSWKYINV